MANANRPSGFTPVQYLNGSTWSGQARLYSIAAAYATALYIGDPVISSGTADVNGVPGIVLGAATGALRGVIVGLGSSEGLPANIINPNVAYRPAAAQTTDWYAMVVDDPNVIFAIQEESNGTAIAATTATLQLRLMGLVRTSDNGFGAYAKHLVKINVHELGTGTGAAGV